MYMPDFEYHTPETLTEACALLDELGEQATVLAGGTDVLHKMKVGKLAPGHLVSLKNLDDLRTISHEPGRGIVMGALTSHNAIYTSRLLQKRYLSLPMAAHTMASNQICNMGTVGGNIVNGVPSADLPPILIALNASIRLVSSKGERTMPLEDFFHGSAETVIAPGELLADITIPDQPTTGSTYMKFGLRRSGALAVVGVAVSVTVKGDILEDVRIVLASAAPTVMRARKAEDRLRGKKISDELLAEAGEEAAAESRPRDSIRGSAEYRRNLVGVLTKRALRKAIDEGHS
ncbi:molybdopterin dehydrogenase FAD-binding [Geobacter metallireducens RCH3]|uniref:4-hydroxybenzoyl-CoA reductase flavoprotein subunit n=1 Tax=Geobacter metallireducens (strain ATCC 53774 / DSM 7210 / GS-15) TaxID=269799 RepID=Q39TR1_GEOMG|nr:xanthine dehydrogenase family protein subunit M [Geobacter metallireducens]ABB32363.1 4-hydroxybenzoyl-CoA reductase flavoprotein subunit [Geobacter metallireducens GS-15]EHP86747.1 molybdopterin dehydrogenase FAD-binding [Geobacter metallireducens RCH3]